MLFQKFLVTFFYHTRNKFMPQYVVLVNSNHKFDTAQEKP